MKNLIPIVLGGFFFFAFNYQNGGYFPIGAFKSLADCQAKAKVAALRSASDALAERIAVAGAAVDGRRSGLRGHGLCAGRGEFAGRSKPMTRVEAYDRCLFFIAALIFVLALCVAYC